MRSQAMTFDDCLHYLENHKEEELQTNIPFLGVLELLVGRAYRHMRAKGYTRDMAMRFMLWTLFYFVQKDNILTDEDAEILLTAMRAAQANAYFASGAKCEEDECIQ